MECFDSNITNLDLRNTKCVTFNDSESLKAWLTYAPNLTGEYSYTIALPTGVDTFDLTTLPGKFNVKYAKNWKGGSVSGTILNVNSSKVTYTYDCGKGCSLDVTLNIKQSASAKLATPAVSDAVSTTGGVKLTWKAVTGAENYAVYRRTESGSWKVKGYTTKTEYNDASAVSGTTYYYTVRCMSADGTTAKSDYDPNGLKITCK